MSTTIFYPDIFNDVYGPIMQPGSSSHTAGPCRIGYCAYSLLGEKPSRVHIILDKNGSFAGTFGHMNEDLGMLAGAYGLLPDDERLFDIKSILEQENIEYEFEFSEIKESTHTNAVKFILSTNTSDKPSCSVTLTGNSTGGGMMEIINVDGYPISYYGERCISVFDLIKESSTDIENIPEKYKDYVFSSVLPASFTNARKEQLFNSITDLIKYANENNKSLFEAVLDYETSFTGWTKNEVINYFEKIKQAMHKQCTEYIKDDSKVFETPFSGYYCKEWISYSRSNPIYAGDVVKSALEYAFCAQTMSKGVLIVPGPMGNGGGYIYSVLRAAADNYPELEDKLLEGIAIAGIFGAIAYTRTSPTGEVIGCTGECGICASMAAAGLTYIRGGNPSQVESAASLTLQAMLGLPCDPIPGGFNQPCTSRVVSAVTLAVTFADLALSGRSGVIPYHEVLDSADQIGKALPNGCKCTSTGGICLTPSALNCKKQFEEWHNK
ncbi:L-serine ammonia-lyase, iron-sulfur-dependent, subunit alpha [Eubacterium sp.]|uniref:L-serine ammonia-lyase, iron-sulfur-dependent, subunit alpha n=1 Tax=Eubacterium sp. TaxID=142586 RepID=UPI0025DA61E8|nr:L-serine ammonia-lyase, iron-sulfur-dependent, subunit alpha [Eubacterium sp.]MCR5628899.1 L-serine ammonia-lyase, iron-sulfur-dependent, subunit alpha [Eubacterium sp.]